MMPNVQPSPDLAASAEPTVSDHTLHRVDDALNTIKGDVLRLGRGAQEQLTRAIKAVVEQSTDLAQQVIDGDAKLDEMKKEIDAEALRIIALYHPLADDLRRTIAAIKIAPMWERIGDIAANIARRCFATEDKPSGVSSTWGRFGDFTKALVARDLGKAQTELVNNQSRSIEHIGGLAASMIDDVLKGYENDAVEPNVAVWQSGDEIDQCYDVLFGQIIDFQAKEPRLAKACVDFLFTAKNLERVGDYVEQIAEIFYFEKTGEDIAKASLA